MDTSTSVVPRRTHLTRLLSIWRSAGWPCRDAIEVDLLAAGWANLARSASGHETLELTSAGLRLLADSRRRSVRALSAHDRLAERVARHLVGAGRVVWRELSLRARVGTDAAPAPAFDRRTDEMLWPREPGDQAGMEAGSDAMHGAKAAWRLARPDVFSVRHTSVEDYLHPIVHEVKVNRADLLSDLRHAAKREAYRWLSCETYFVFPAGLAEPREIPDDFGIWVTRDSKDDGGLELVRPARHSPCKLPFSVWMAMAKAAPLQPDLENIQHQLGRTDTADKTFFAYSQPSPISGAKIPTT